MIRFIQSFFLSNSISLKRKTKYFTEKSDRTRWDNILLIGEEREVYSANDLPYCLCIYSMFSFYVSKIKFWTLHFAKFLFLHLIKETLFTNLYFYKNDSSR